MYNDWLAWASRDRQKPRARVARDRDHKKYYFDMLSMAVWEGVVMDFFEILKYPTGYLVCNV